MSMMANDKRKFATLAMALTGASLAATHWFVRRKADEAEAGNRPLGRFITVDGVRLHYIDRGHGPAVVFLHGNATSMQDFELSGITALDREQFRVISFDRPGFGYSERPAGEKWTALRQARLIGKALAQLGVEEPTIVAHSWGTLVALELAADAGIALRSLVLLSGYYFPGPRIDTLLAKGPTLPVVGPLLRNTVLPLFGRLMWPTVRTQLFAPSLPTAGFLDFPVWMALRPQQLAAASAEGAMMNACARHLADRYASLNVPAFIACGQGDGVVSPDQSRRLHQQLPRSELLEFPDVGHMIQHAIPLEILRIIRRAVTEVPLPGDGRHQDPAGPGSKIWH